MSVSYSTRVPKIIAGAEQTADKIVRKYAFDILAASQKTVPVAKVDGGTLRNSGEVITPGTAKAIISYGAHYAAYVELGTRRMAARPYLKPAFERVVPAFTRAMRQVVEP